MLKGWGKYFLIFALLAYVIWIHWWASSHYALDGEICADPEKHKDCDSYNVILYSVWRLASVLNFWNGLITALATMAIAGFTWTLYQSSENMWRVTKIAADAAQKSAETAEKSLLAANQPLLIIEELLLVGPHAIEPPRIKFTIANDGNGTAVVLSIGGHIQITEVAGHVEPITMRDVWNNRMGTSIAKGAKFGPLVITHKSLNEKRYNGIKDGGTKIFLDLRIGAQDIFKSSYPQEFAFTFDSHAGNFVRDDSNKPKQTAKT